MWALQRGSIQQFFLVFQFITVNNLLTGWLECGNPSQPSCQPQCSLLWLTPAKLLQDSELCPVVGQTAWKSWAGEALIIPASSLGWAVPQAASGVHLNWTHLLHPAFQGFLTVNLRPASKRSSKQGAWMGGKPSLGHACAMAGHNTDANILYGLCCTGKSEIPLLIPLGKLWPLDHEDPALHFSGVVFIHHL